MARVDFARPPGEPALISPHSVTWRLSKNPVAIFSGGVAAVLLDLAHPLVRAAVWDSRGFRADPAGRLRRTGLATMMAVYAPRGAAERMIAKVTTVHQRVRGTAPDGRPYCATDPELLSWVQGTATFGLVESYHRYVAPLTEAQRSRPFAEALPAARLYGAMDAPVSEAAWDAMTAALDPEIEPSPILHEFLDLMHAAPILPGALRPLQGTILRGAVDLLPPWIRERLELMRRGLRPGEGRILRAVGGLSERLVLPRAPPAQACLRMGLPVDHLYEPIISSSLIPVPRLRAPWRPASPLPASRRR